MGYTALYRKFRPINFNETVGQDHIIKTLKNQIISNRVGHAYLLNGGRGTGKTSTAKILARAINCINPIDGEPCNECEICKGALSGALTDIVEMDAASNNSVEDIRSIREEVNFLPTKAKYRIYIIDEVHMLSTGAFNALLKTLEEPPEHAKFILATTEPQKLPATILSRCQRFDFKRISNEDIVRRLEIVCKESEINITKSALNIIAVLADGALRDALSILERCIQDGSNDISEEKVKELAGIPNTIFIHNITNSIIKCDVEEAIKATEAVLNDGKDIINILWEVIKYVKDILVFKTTKKLEIYNEEESSRIKDLTQNVSKEKLISLIYSLSELESNIKWATQKTIMFEAGIIKLCNQTIEIQDDSINNNLKSDSNSGNNQNTQIISRIEKIENYLRNNNNSTNNSKSNNNQVNNININKQNSNQLITPKNVNVKNNIKFSNKPAEYWPQILNELKQSGKMLLHTNLKNTYAKEINDITVGIQFNDEINSFQKTILENSQNVKDITYLISMACGREMNIKYIEPENNSKISNYSPTEDLQNIANNANIDFNII